MDLHLKGQEGKKPFIKEKTPREEEGSPESSPEFTRHDEEIISEGVHEAGVVNPHKGEKVQDVDTLFPQHVRRH